MIGAWASYAPIATGVIDLEELYGADYIPWDSIINPLYLGFGAIMGLLVGAFFAKLQTDKWAWIAASIITVVAAGVVPFTMGSHGPATAQATAIGMMAPFAFSVVQGAWLFPWRQRPWTVDEEDE
jgi:Na+/melibiose symporter-like transporter